MNTARDSFTSLSKARAFFLITLASLAGLAGADAAISVGPAGAGPIGFTTQPTVAEGWSTVTNSGTSADITSAAQLDMAVNLVDASTISSPVPVSGTTAPSIAQSNVPRWNGNLNLIQSVATTAAFLPLLATLQNDTGVEQSGVRVSFLLGELHAAGTTVSEQIPGFRVYWSLTGLPGSWQAINALSSVGTPGNLTATLNLGSWAAGGTLYLLWADDNATANRDNTGTEEGGYTIDDFSVALGTDGVFITAPADGQAFTVGAPILITASATLPGAVTSIAFRSNGALLGTDTTAPYEFTYNNAPLGTNSLVAVASDNLGNTLTSAVVRAIVNPNQAPTVALPIPIAFEYITASNVVLTATATDADGTVAQVRFFDGATLLNTDTTAPYSFNWLNPSPGRHTLTAVATDNLGLSVTSAPVTITVVTPLPSFVPFGATWRYLDNGSDLGPPGGLGAWTDFLFDDSLWISGAAELGYGDGDEVTTVGFGGNPNAKHITTYFRHQFAVEDFNSVTSFSLRLRADDGARVFLNNQLVMTYNLPETVDFQTQAIAGVEDDPIVGTNIVVDGINVFFLPDNLLAVEVHQATNNSSDLSFDLELIPNPPPTPPVVSVNIPLGTELLSPPAVIPLNVTSYDLDGGIVDMDFYDNGAQVGSFADSIFIGTYTVNTPGIHTISVIVTDNSGLTATSTVSVLVRPAPVDVVLLDTNATWNFLDDGTDQGTAWRAPGFDDGAWSSGQAELGYGDMDEVTTVNFGPDANNKFITTYFRRVFDVTSTNGFTNVQVRLRRDDGAIVYLNGAEVFRSNMPLGPVNFQTLAGGATGSETAFNLANLSPGLLLVGPNTIAVEVHQNAVNSSDLSFELQLVGQIPPPTLSISRDAVDPTVLHLSWAPNLPGYVLEEAADPAGPWTPSFDQGNPQAIVFDLSDPPKFYRLTAP